MKSVSHRLKPLAMAAFVALSWTYPTPRQVASATTTANLTVDFEPIEIYVPPPESRVNGFCPQYLEPTINQIINSSPVATAKWGILIESLANKTTLYSHNANTSLIPASNVKLFTTAAALQTLSPGSKIGSTSVEEWIKTTNLNSNNNYAETLMRRLGGPYAVKQTLTQLGINPNGYRLADGSGLSRQNSATPTAIVETLRAMSYAPGRDVFLSSLPVAGQSGTLRNRLRQTSAQGMVNAKTGTLRGVKSLSGYLEHPYYGTLVFSIMVNQPNLSGAAMTGAIDNIVLQLTQLKTC